MTAELPCNLTVRASLSGRDGQPTIRPERCPAAMPPHGRGGEFNRRADAGALFVGAVGACYAVTLGGILDARQLPWAALEIEVDAAIALAQGMPHLDAITVNPEVLGGDAVARGLYSDAARQARDQSLAGRAIRGNVALKIGAVTITALGGAGMGPASPDARNTEEEM